MLDSDDTDEPALETRIASGLHYADAGTGAVMPPIHTSTTYARGGDYRLPDSDVSYTRAQNPTYRLAEAMIATLEGGAAALLFASGMAAATAVFRALAPGDRVVVPGNMYYGLRRWLAGFCPHWGIELATYDTGRPASLGEAVTDGTRLVWVESPSNPLWDVTDIAEAARLAHAAGAALAVDSTVATPVHTQRIATERGEGGAVCGPFEAWLLQRGMRTLFLRQHRASASALAVAEALARHPNVGRVSYPGLPDHPGHAVARRQMRDGFGSLLSFTVRGGRDEALAVVSALRLFAPATSLGGVESLVEHRATVEGEDSPIPDNLLRLSIGIEAPGDLIADLGRALETLNTTP